MFTHGFHQGIRKINAQKGKLICSLVLLCIFCFQAKHFRIELSHNKIIQAC